MARLLHVTSPMISGQDVLQVQRRLVALHYSPGVPDGVYGPMTATAVRAFQRDQKLTVDGVVGPMTLAALEAANTPAVPAVSLLGQQALAEAVKHIGVKEDPPTSNQTLFGKWFGVNGVAWCNIFVSYCFQIGAGYTIVENFAGGAAAGVFAGKGCSFVPTTEAWLKATGMWIGKATPQRGDIVIYNWDGGRADHIGIVESYGGGLVFDAIEGNTAHGNDSNGGEVMRRTRSFSQINGFGRVIE